MISGPEIAITKGENVVENIEGGVMEDMIYNFDPSEMEETHNSILFYLP